jgi:hypothetical protein
MVYGLVYGCYPMHVPPRPLWDTVHSPDMRLWMRTCKQAYRPQGTVSSVLAVSDKARGGVTMLSLL